LIKVDLPLPETPVISTSACKGMSTEILRILYKETFLREIKPLDFLRVIGISMLASPLKYLPVMLLG
jgi:hypothetical protein